MRHDLKKTIEIIMAVLLVAATISGASAYSDWMHFYTSGGRQPYHSWDYSLNSWPATDVGDFDYEYTTDSYTKFGALVDDQYHYIFLAELSILTVLDNQGNLIAQKTFNGTLMAPPGLADDQSGNVYFVVPVFADGRATYRVYLFNGTTLSLHFSLTPSEYGYDGTHYGTGVFCDEVFGRCSFQYGTGMYTINVNTHSVAEVVSSTFGGYNMAINESWTGLNGCSMPDHSTYIGGVTGGDLDGDGNQEVLFYHLGATNTSALFWHVAEYDMIDNTVDRIGNISISNGWSCSAYPLDIVYNLAPVAVGQVGSVISIPEIFYETRFEIPSQGYWFTSARVLDYAFNTIFTVFNSYESTLSNFVTGDFDADGAIEFGILNGGYLHTYDSNYSLLSSCHNVVGVGDATVLTAVPGILNNAGWSFILGNVAYSRTPNGGSCNHIGNISQNSYDIYIPVDIDDDGASDLIATTESSAHIFRTSSSPLTCTDYDGGIKPLIPGNVSFIPGGNVYFDNCADEWGDYINEYSCSGNSLATSTLSCFDLGFDCIQGGNGDFCGNSSNITSDCVDTDRNINPTINYTFAGVVTLNSTNYSDSCNGNILTEQYCINTTARSSESYNCSLVNKSCIGNRCVSTAGNTCTDTDTQIYPTQAYEIKGTATGSIVREDCCVNENYTCTNSSSTMLLERYCSAYNDSAVLSNLYDCDILGKICQNGACVYAGGGGEICIDSDTYHAGNDSYTYPSKNYTILGTMWYGDPVNHTGQNYFDYCDSPTVLREMYCQDVNTPVIQGEAYDCSLLGLSCVNGACREGTNNSCTDTDTTQFPSTNYYIKGTLTSTVNGVPTTTDDSCVDTSTLKEYYCQSFTNTTIFSANYNCGSEGKNCINGACTGNCSLPTCVFPCILWDDFSYLCTLIQAGWSILPYNYNLTPVGGQMCYNDLSTGTEFARYLNPGHFVDIVTEEFNLTMPNTSGADFTATMRYFDGTDHEYKQIYYLDFSYDINSGQVTLAVWAKINGDDTLISVGSNVLQVGVETSIKIVHYNFDTLGRSFFNSSANRSQLIQPQTYAVIINNNANTSYFNLPQFEPLIQGHSNLISGINFAWNKNNCIDDLKVYDGTTFDAWDLTTPDPFNITAIKGCWNSKTGHFECLISGCQDCCETLPNGSFRVKDFGCTMGKYAGFELDKVKQWILGNLITFIILLLLLILVIPIMLKILEIYHMSKGY
jgi:hypothetical protein